MPINIDEPILISQRIDESDSQPIISQALRIAIYDEFKAYENYTKIIEKFGAVNPFVNIREAEARHYSMLIPLLQKYEVEVPINDWALKLTAPNSYIEACELGVAGEIKNIQMYEHLLGYVQESDVRDAFYRLQARSYNNHLPAFRRCVVQHYSSSTNPQGFSQEKMMEMIGEYQAVFEDVLNGNMDQSKLTELFSKLNISMISGVAFGGASIAFLNNYLNKKNNEE